jgi:hypothetical protein
VKLASRTTNRARVVVVHIGDNLQSGFDSEIHSCLLALFLFTRDGDGGQEQNRQGDNARHQLCAGDGRMVAAMLLVFALAERF